MPIFNNQIIRACLTPNKWHILDIPNSTFKNVVNIHERLMTQPLCRQLIEARVSKLSWMELYPLRVDDPNNKDIDMSMEDAAAEKKRLIDWCENMKNIDITEHVMMCEKDLCNGAAGLLLWGGGAGVTGLFGTLYRLLASRMTIVMVTATVFVTENLYK